MNSPSPSPDFAGLRRRVEHYRLGPLPPRLALAAAAALAKAGYRLRRPCPLIGGGVIELALLVAELTHTHTPPNARKESHDAA